MDEKPEKISRQSETFGASLRWPEGMGSLKLQKGFSKFLQWIDYKIYWVTEQDVSQEMEGS